MNTPHHKINRATFFANEWAYLNLGRALCYRHAWEIATRERGSRVLRAVLRDAMRNYALAAVSVARAAEARGAAQLAAA